MSKNITITALLSVLTVILFTFQMLPPFGVALAYFAVLPLMYIKYLTSTKYYIISLITSFFLILFLNDPFGWLFFGLLLVPMSAAITYKNKIIKFIMLCIVEFGSYIIFKVLNISTSSLDTNLAKMWIIIGLFFYFATYYFYKKTYFISLKFLNHNLHWKGEKE